MKTASCYIRVSTDEQIEYSPASQLEAIKKYADLHNYFIPEKFIFIDDGISGRHTAKRTAFNNMIYTAKQKPKPFECILLWKFSRFARNRQDSIVYKTMLRKELGIDVISITENIGDDKISVLIEALIEAMDEYYSINLAEEVKRGMLEKAKRGEFCSAAPFGYKMIDKKLVIDNDKFHILNKIFELYYNGFSSRNIAVWLNNNGYRTNRGGFFENRTVEYILNNPTYIGKIHWNIKDKNNSIFVDGKHSSIISNDLWNEVQSKMSYNKSKYKKYSRDVSLVKFDFQGLIRCNSCGATLVKSGSGIQCNNYSKGSCIISHYISMNKLLDLMTNIIQYFFKSSFKISINNLKVTDDFEYSKKLNKLNSKLIRIKDAFECGAYTLSEYIESKSKTEQEISLLSKKANAVNLKPTVHKISVSNSTIYNQITNNKLSSSIKNDLLKIFISKIEFDKKSNHFSLYLTT